MESVWIARERERKVRDFKQITRPDKGEMKQERLPHAHARPQHWAES